MNTENNDKRFMRLAIDEARKGLGRTSPNPCVGAVVVADGKIIATGYHKKAGTPHAEIHALRAAGDAARGATMYVTLEPCNHTGKTPPCSHAVARAGISRVVVGMTDPNPLVDGTGIDYLRDHGITVVSGILEEECQEINRPFIKHVTTGLPWMVMKAGVSLDGRLNYQQGNSGWITGALSGEKVHELRNIHDAILVGSETVAIDNPSLTTRLKQGDGKDPIRVILDRTLRLPIEAKSFSIESQAQAWVFCSHDADSGKRAQLESKGVRVFSVQGNETGLALPEVVAVLGRNGVNSVFVEGGAAIHGAMLRQKLYDYAYLFVAPRFAGDKGVSLVTGYEAADRDSSVSLQNVRHTTLGDDVLIAGEMHYPG
ncbi:bifunctional diaminohydroxyphosphoribosylaminopyrimidine deaminase/5-amino-6-(5-phosphoribosylamino)uracil reductase RibD [Desulfosediminicola sp.]|uniref:bifunctional diaminohydroxyphosphoribosylaminopyrimidine deaminase/5-amino-6-(5-phosphoribosylamino)uracil reductase RibD n=1 Tax=Desulfosediminicola sp. TaxID=2886825 RepID=UPI003AF22A77